jgi:hypothetical protein
MLTIHCSKCRKKLFKYEKIGRGRVLKCFKDLISHNASNIEEDKLKCNCGNIIGLDKGTYFQMKANQFIFTGKKKDS